MNQDNNAQSNPEETVVVEEAAEAVEATASLEASCFMTSLG